MKPYILYFLNLLWFLPLIFINENVIVTFIASVFLALLDFSFSRKINKWKPKEIIASLDEIKKFNYSILIVFLIPLTQLIGSSDNTMSINFLIFLIVFLLREIILYSTLDKFQYLIVIIEGQIIFNNIWLQKRDLIDLKCITLNSFTNRVRFKFKNSFLTFSYGLNEFPYVDLEKFVLEVLKINSNVEISENLGKKLNLNNTEVV